MRMNPQPLSLLISLSQFQSHINKNVYKTHTIEKQSEKIYVLFAMYIIFTLHIMPDMNLNNNLKLDF